MEETGGNIQAGRQNVAKRAGQVADLIANNQGLSMLSNVTGLAQNLKVVPIEQKELAFVNNANIALNSRYVANVSGRVLSLMGQIPKTGLDPSQKVIMQTIITETQSLKTEADKLSQTAEGATTEDDIGEELSKFVNATTYSQVISKELQEIGKEMNENGDLEKVMNISESVITACDELQKPAGENRKFASSLLEKMKKFKQTIIDGVKGLKPSITGGLKEALILLLKEVSNLLVNLLQV